ncbi:hypothetical protein BDBG_05976 [Blastomyces gilchristii SLH14081]|uniref:Uncharacterized protein n=1 Tax=Blastomyces gilchristii (strain SLH14081) TaxID=559298 RepID=A0A179UR25_BLAGS|nr:uncharacterized protein BDBG_05976 [Blastomyces gilchristii SLH14081]OAT10320.1 hypothetical protein BDBG_05976 [Blastomyces gilchristii SLH14081]
MDLPSEFEAMLLDAKQFAAYPHLEALLSMVNEAFDIRHRESFATHEQGRFESLEELVESLDAVGRCCIITQTQKNQAPRIVACSILKAYFEWDPASDPALKKEDARDISTQNGVNGTSEPREPPGSETNLTLAALNAKNEDPDMDFRSVTDWELGVVVVRQDPQLSKLGLAVRCAALLEQDLLERLERAEKEDANGAITPVDQQKPLTFWVKTAAIVNGSYWHRRGYETIRTRIFPEGYWGAYREFEVAWMNKCIPRRAVSDLSTPVNDVTIVNFRNGDISDNSQSL